MKLWSAVLLLSVAALSFSSACPNPSLKLGASKTFTPPESAFILTKEQAVENNDKTVNVHQGQDIIIQLKSNPGSTGYSWQLSDHLKTSYSTVEHHDISYMSCKYKKPVTKSGSKPQMGASGNDFLWFHIADDANVESNPHTIALKYGEAWSEKPETELTDRDWMTYKFNILAKQE